MTNLGRGKLAKFKQPGLHRPKLILAEVGWCDESHTRAATGRWGLCHCHLGHCWATAGHCWQEQTGGSEPPWSCCREGANPPCGVWGLVALSGVQVQQVLQCCGSGWPQLTQRKDLPLSPEQWAPQSPGFRLEQPSLDYRVTEAFMVEKPSESIESEL